MAKSKMDDTSSKSKKKKTKGSTAKTRSKKEPKTAKPIVRYDPETGDKIYIETVTLSQIKQAKRNKGNASSSSSRSKRKVLVRIPSHDTRQTCYEEAAQAIQYWEEQLLPSYGGRMWHIQVQLDEPQGRKTPLFRWYRGKLELAVLPHLLEQVPMEKEVKLRGYEKLIQQSKGEEKEPSAHALSERPISALSTWAWEEGHDYGIPIVSIKWTSPNGDFVTRQRSKAIAEAEQLVTQTLTIDKVLSGRGSRGQLLRPTKCTRAEALQVGRWRFLRDGLWVVGQEESWQEEREFVWKQREDAKQKEQQQKQQDVKKRKSSSRTASIPNGPPTKPLSALAYFLKTERLQWRDRRLKELIAKQEQQHAQRKAAAASAPTADTAGNDATTTSSSSSAVTATSIAAPPPSLTLLQTESEMRQHWRIGKVSKKEQNRYKQAAQQDFEKALQAWQEKNPGKTVEEKGKEDDVVVGDYNVKVDVPPDSEPRAVTPGESDEEEHEGPSNAVDESTVMESTAAMKPAAVDEHRQTESLSNNLISPPTTTSTSSTTFSAEVSERPSTTTHKRKPRRKRSFAQSSHWRLPNDVLDLCFDACMEHYEQVMNTVKARGLNFELADGFDVLRERGRGRYDMELPTFDTPKFQFLTCLETAPWMPLVREILGLDVVLIHKGCFLSMPGAESQKYHQDGPHLSTQKHRPCHAVNVFIPLVDLEASNGPTEFSLGSHILGYEDYNEDNLCMPTVAAGTPIIFDYRLGHRGMANKSSYCRPLLYCTYAAAANGKEFRDSVNFSSRRYHKIGEMVARPMTRDERTRKRKKELEQRSYEQELQLALAQSSKASQQKEAPVAATASSIAGASVCKHLVEESKKRSKNEAAAPEGSCSPTKKLSFTVVKPFSLPLKVVSNSNNDSASGDASSNTDRPKTSLDDKKSVIVTNAMS